MVRLSREAADLDGIIGGGGGGGFGFLVFVLGLLVTLCIVSTVIFSCADGVSKEKSSSADTELYGGGGCAAGCGAACGG
ncbi:hypothetical protein L484_013262 [Morus notabilis]|uniref:Uncharacterized protein n=1 Tax=Morus notabilis TaxID=981085 RepID=W9SC63_9ROSA|nr:uncharacterized protein LOC21396442 [Morus notabilis]EXC25174.1 hypothetical protein L484_013262 [Morus notabilis]